MNATSCPSHSLARWPRVLLVGMILGLLAACAPGAGLPSQPQVSAGPTATGAEATSSTPAATASTGGSVVPVITF